MSDLKIAFCADIHAHNFKDFSHEIQVSWDDDFMKYMEDEHGCLMNDRLLVLTDAMLDMADYCHAHNIHHLLIGGDVFHQRSRLDVSVMNAVRNTFRMFQSRELDVYVIPGNHDMVDNSDHPMHSLEMLADYSHVIDTPSVVFLHDQDAEDAAVRYVYDSPDPFVPVAKTHVPVVFMPYTRNKTQFLQDLDEQLNVANNADTPDHRDRQKPILLAHLGVDGARVGSGMTAINDAYNVFELRPDDFQFIALGHYHHPQHLLPKVIYCGCPVQNNFNDEREMVDGHAVPNGFWVYDTQLLKAEFIPLDAPCFITLTPDQIANVKHLGLHEHYVRVRGRADQVKQITAAIEQTDVFADVRLELEKEYVQQQRSGIQIGMSPEQVVQTWYNEDENKSNLPPDALAVGLDILKKVSVM